MGGTDRIRNLFMCRMGSNQIYELALVKSGRTNTERCDRNRTAER